MLRPVSICALLSSSSAARITGKDVFDKDGCPQTTSESSCPGDHHFCRKTKGCYPDDSDKSQKMCGTPLCPRPGTGGSRSEAVVLEDANDACPSANPCPTGMAVCVEDQGCYNSGDKRCKTLCGGASPAKGKKAVKSSKSAKASPRPSPRPRASSPRPRPTNIQAYKIPSGSEYLQPVDTAIPPQEQFPASSEHYMPPRNINPSIKTPSTNKFWTNWISGKPKSSQKPVYTMPYSLRFSDSDGGWKCHYYEAGQDNAWCKSKPTEGNNQYDYLPGGTCGHCHCCRRPLELRAELGISHREPKLKYNKETSDRRGRIAYYISRFIGSYSLGLKEGTTKDHFKIEKESLLGVRAVIKTSSGGKVEFPAYRGMPYISGKFDKATPRISSPQGLIRSMKKVDKGVFEFTNDEGHPDKAWDCHYYDKGQSDGWCKTAGVVKDTEYGFYGDSKSPCGECDCCQRPANMGESFGEVYHVFVLDNGGNFMDGDFTNSSSGFMFNKKLSGWVRMAHIVNPQDKKTYKKYATSFLESVSLDVKNENEFHYNFKTSGKGEYLHLGWRHQKKLLQNMKEVPVKELTHIRAPTKGEMVPILGTKWILKINTDKAKKLTLLPAVDPQGSKRDAVKKELRKDLEQLIECHERDSWSTRECAGPRTWIFTAGFYTNGKGLQKLGTMCLMSQKLFGASDPGTKACGDLLQKAFMCHYDTSSGCGGVPRAFYDSKWGGIASKQGFTTRMCGLADFGNACYNDHHYHYGYFIHAAAQMLEIKPEMKNDNAFVAYINSFVRDIMNPSKKDKYFPQFRAFDWYDLHSWSHGVTPSSDGKDEESTSEDVNAYFGVQMWAQRLGHKSLESTARMVLSLLSFSASNLFLMKDGNDVHPPDFVKNRVTGIFFEAKVHYGTFFGADECYIHGIQMIPLSPALRLARSTEFCKQEWRDILSRRGLPLPGKHSWSSLLITGNLAFHKPAEAWDKLKLLKELDRGLSRSWAMYWIASLDAEKR